MSERREKQIGWDLASIPRLVSDSAFLGVRVHAYAIWWVIDAGWNDVLSNCNARAMRKQLVLFNTMEHRVYVVNVEPDTPAIIFRLAINLQITTMTRAFSGLLNGSVEVLQITIAGLTTERTSAAAIFYHAIGWCVGSIIGSVMGCQDYSWPLIGRFWLDSP